MAHYNIAMESLISQMIWQCGTERRWCMCVSWVYSIFFGICLVILWLFIIIIVTKQAKLRFLLQPSFDIFATTYSISVWLIRLHKLTHTSTHRYNQRTTLSADTRMSMLAKNSLFTDQIRTHTHTYSISLGVSTNRISKTRYIYIEMEFHKIIPRCIRIKPFS